MLRRTLSIVLLSSFSLFAKAQSITEKDMERVIQLLYTGHEEEAVHKVDSFRAIIVSSDPMYPGFLQLSLEVNSRAYRYRQAVSDMEEIIRLNLGSEKDFLLSMGQFKSYLGDHQGAIQALQKLLEFEPGNKDICSNLAATYNRAGLYRMTINTLNESKPQEDSVSRYYIYYHYAFAYLHLGILDSALNHINIYLRSGNSDNDFQANLVAARIYHGLNQKKTACAFISKADTSLRKSKIEEQLSKLSPEQQGYDISKSLKATIAEIKRLGLELCE